MWERRLDRLGDLLASLTKLNNDELSVGVSKRTGSSGYPQNLLDHPRRPAVGQPLFAAVGVVDEPVVVEAEEVQDRRLEVVGRDDVLDRAVADLVGGAVGHAALDAAAGQPDREALAVVVAAGAARRGCPR